MTTLLLMTALCVPQQTTVHDQYRDMFMSSRGKVMSMNSVPAEETEGLSRPLAMFKKSVVAVDKAWTAVRYSDDQFDVLRRTYKADGLTIQVNDFGYSCVFRIIGDQVKGLGADQTKEAVGKVIRQFLEIPEFPADQIVATCNPRKTDDQPITMGSYMFGVQEADLSGGRTGYKSVGKEHWYSWIPFSYQNGELDVRVMYEVDDSKMGGQGEAPPGTDRWKRFGK